MTSRTFVLPFLLLLHGAACADIELRSSKEEAQPRSTTITLGIKVLRRTSRLR